MLNTWRILTTKSSSELSKIILESNPRKNIYNTVYDIIKSRETFTIQLNSRHNESKTVQQLCLGDSSCII